jgi:hypothetical protein
MALEQKITVLSCGISFFRVQFGNNSELYRRMKNLNLLKTLTLQMNSFRKMIGLFLLFFSALSSANPKAVGELSLRYKMMSNDYQTSSELLDSVFGDFIKTQSYWSLSSSELAHNKEFLVQLQKFSQSMNQLVGGQDNDEQKKNSLEALTTIMSESTPSNEHGWPISAKDLSRVFKIDDGK